MRHQRVGELSTGWQVGSDATLVPEPWRVAFANRLDLNLQASRRLGCGLSVPDDQSFVSSLVLQLALRIHVWFPVAGVLGEELCARSPRPTREINSAQDREVMLDG